MSKIIASAAIRGAHGYVNEAEESLKAMRIVVITTKPHFAIDDTYDWLEHHRVPNDEVHILEDKTAVDCDVYLDDADHNVEALTVHHPTATVCRYVRPWNNPTPGAIDVTDWNSFRTVVGGLAPG